MSQVFQQEMVSGNYNYTTYVALSVVYEYVAYNLYIPQLWLNSMMHR